MNNLPRTQGWTTVFLQLQSGFEQPSYALFASSRSCSHSPMKKEAVLAIRGTASVQDIVTDIRAEPMFFPPSDEDLCRGVAAMTTHPHPHTYDVNDPIHTLHPTDHHPVHPIRSNDPAHPVSPPHDPPLDARATRGTIAGGDTAAVKMAQFLNGGVMQQQPQQQQHKQSHFFSSLSARGVDKDKDKVKGKSSDKDKNGTVESEDEDEDEDDGWVHVEGGTTYACGGMARAAHWLLEEVGPSLLMLVEQVRGQGQRE